jgi:hypothetical protein
MCTFVHFSGRSGVHRPIYNAAQDGQNIELLSGKSVNRIDEFS